MRHARVGVGGPPRQRGRRRLLAATLSAVIMAGGTGCGSPGRLGSLDGGQASITQEDLERVDVPTAFMAVERLRPDWLRTRGPTSPRTPGGNLPAVYVAGVRQQAGLEALRQVRLGDVLEIQYLSAVDATTRYGTDHAGGAIIVVLR